jgi:hypothetical protein
MKKYLYLAHWNGGMPNKDPCYDTRRERESWMTVSILFSSTSRCGGWDISWQIKEVTVLKKNSVLLALNISFFVASWVADQALKIYIDEEDNRRPPQTLQS